MGIAARRPACSDRRRPPQIVLAASSASTRLRATRMGRDRPSILPSPDLAVALRDPVPGSRASCLCRLAIATSSAWSSRSRVSRSPTLLGQARQHRPVTLAGGPWRTNVAQRRHGLHGRAHRPRCAGRRPDPCSGEVRASTQSPIDRPPPSKGRRSRVLVRPAVPPAWSTAHDPGFPWR